LEEAQDGLNEIRGFDIKKTPEILKRKAFILELLRRISRFPHLAHDILPEGNIY